MPASRPEAYELLSNPARLGQLLKDHLEVEVKRGADSLRRGAEYELVMTRYGLSQPVRLRVEEVVKGARLTYRQAEGLFADWIHTIRFEDHGDNQTLVTDYVDYRLPFGILGYLADDLFVRKDMERLLFDRLNRARDYFLAVDSNSQQK